MSVGCSALVELALPAKNPMRIVPLFYLPQACGAVDDPNWS